MKFKTVIASLIKTTALVLALAVVFPSVVKLSHSFNHDKHTTCDADLNHNTHFHQSDLDCDFYKFKLSKIQFFIVEAFETKLEIPQPKVEAHYYISYHNNQQLIQFLRGPPQLV